MEVTIGRSVPRTGPLALVGRWALRHPLVARPSWRLAWVHGWPWLAVAGMLGYAGCWFGVALALTLTLAIALVVAARKSHLIAAHPAHARRSRPRR